MDRQALPNYGGQAVIEGVMMRGARTYAIAVRAPDEEIVIEQKPLNRMYESRFTKLPFIRGLLLLWDALVLGIQALTFSANIQAEEEDEQLDGVGIFSALGLSLLIWLGLFFVTPAGLAHLIQDNLDWPASSANLIEGLIRLGLFIGYLWGIGQMEDIKRVFRYHGAEHMTINAFEAGEELTIENVRRQSLEHPRCGTAFVLSVVVMSVLLFSLLGPLSLGMRLLSRVILVPVLASLAYEYIRLTARWIKNPLGRLLAKPNLWFQRLTTQQPDDKMLEVAIAAFNAMKAQEEAPIQENAITL